MFRRLRIGRSDDSRCKKSSAYASKRTDEDRLETLSDKLVADLKSELNNIVMCPVFSSEWMNMVKTVHRVCTAVRMEETFEKESKEATLWEGDEAALRMVLEDGKVPVLLRLLEEYKTFQRNAAKSEDERLSDESYQHAALVFEESVCMVLASSFSHAEVVQTISLPLLCSIVRDALEYSLCHPEVLTDEVGFCLEGSAFQMIEQVVREAESIGEDRVLEDILKFDIFVLFIRHLRTNGEKLGQDNVLRGLACLAAIVETELYDIREDEFFSSQSDRTNLIALQDFAQDFSEQDANSARLLRPLVDEIRRLNRANKRK